VALLIFSFYESPQPDSSPEGRYDVDEIIEQGDVIVPGEDEVSPIIDGTEQGVDVTDEVIVEIVDLRFDPQDIIVKTGTTVTWVNKDTSPHKIVAYDRLFYGPRLVPGESYSFTFTQEGTHKYFDAVFPKIGRGKVIVKEDPLPITGGVIGIDLDWEEAQGKFALLVMLFLVMVLGISRAVHKY
jgi:plastocyanin